MACTHRIPPERDLVYLYDGSFEGLCCCIYESFRACEVPAAVFSDSTFQATLYPVHRIETDPAIARRVLRGLAQKVSPTAADLVRLGFLTCHAEKERLILRFAHLAFAVGAGAVEMIQDDAVCALRKAVQFLHNEAHLCKEFLRFSECEGGLAARISPKNFVLPLVVPHFADRLPEEHFLIFDSVHAAAAYYEPYRARFFPAERFDLPPTDECEANWRRLWKQYHRTIAIEGRENLRCQMTHCPKRYWGNMTEFSSRPEISGTIPTVKQLPTAMGR